MTPLSQHTIAGITTSILSFCDGTLMFLLGHRRFPSARLDSYHPHRNNWYFCDDCTMFLDLSLLEDVSHYRFVVIITHDLLLKTLPYLEAKGNPSHLY